MFPTIVCPLPLSVVALYAFKMVRDIDMYLFLACDSPNTCLQCGRLLARVQAVLLRILFALGPT